MEITYLGHSCFKLKAKEGMTVLIDPFDKEFVGLPITKELADIVVSTHDHKDHNNIGLVEGAVNRTTPFIVNREGEYEIGGVEVLAMSVPHDAKNGEERGKTLMVFVRMDGIRFLHLGDIGTKLTDSQVEKIGEVDVLCVPVGGTWTVGASEAVEIVKEISPSLVIPMHYRVSGLKEEFGALTGIESFLEKVKYPMYGEPVHKVKVDTGNLPDDTQVLQMI